EEEAGVENGQQQRQSPERGRPLHTDREEQQQAEADDLHGAAAPRGLQRAPEAPRRDRNAEIERRERDIKHDGAAEMIDGEERRRPCRLGGEAEERREEVQQRAGSGPRAPRDQREQDEERPEEQPRRVDGRVDPPQDETDE